MSNASVSRYFLCRSSPLLKLSLAFSMNLFETNRQSQSSWKYFDGINPVGNFWSNRSRWAHPTKHSLDLSLRLSSSNYVAMLQSELYWHQITYHPPYRHRFPSWGCLVSLQHSVPMYPDIFLSCSTGHMLFDAAHRWIGFFHERFLRTNPNRAGSVDQPRMWVSALSINAATLSLSSLFPS